MDKKEQRKQRKQKFLQWNRHTKQVQLDLVNSYWETNIKLYEGSDFSPFDGKLIKSWKQLEDDEHLKFALGATKAFNYIISTFAEENYKKDFCLYYALRDIKTNYILPPKKEEIRWKTKKEKNLKDIIPKFIKEFGTKARKAEAEEIRTTWSNARKEEAEKIRTTWSNTLRMYLCPKIGETLFQKIIYYNFTYSSQSHGLESYLKKYKEHSLKTITSWSPFLFISVRREHTYTLDGKETRDWNETTIDFKSAMELGEQKYSLKSVIYSDKNKKYKTLIRDHKTAEQWILIPKNPEFYFKGSFKDCQARLSVSEVPLLFFYEYE